MTTHATHVRLTCVASRRGCRVSRRWRTVTRAGSDTTPSQKKSLSSDPVINPSVPGFGATSGDRVALTTMTASRPTLGVSAWPDFDYDASGATTLGVVDLPDPNHPTRLRLKFDVSSFQGPSVNSKTTKIFGIPLPPGVNIDIVPISLHGWLDQSTGDCELDFDAEFRGWIFGETVVALPAMTIRSPLTTGEAKGMRRRAFGKPFGVTPTGELSPVVTPILTAGGAPVSPNPCLGGVRGDTAELVSVAIVPLTTGKWSWLMNTLLQLPNDALAVLPCRLRVWSPADSAALDDSDQSTESAILENLDKRFELKRAADDSLKCTASQMDLALASFGAATFVEETYNLYA